MSTMHTSHIEEWRATRDYEGYEVSSWGRVRSLDRIDGRGHRRRGRMMGQWSETKGYQKVRLSVSSRQWNVSVHRLVCAAWRGDPPADDSQVRHLDGNKLNNTPNNLAWGTAKQNGADSVRLAEKFNRRKVRCLRGHLFVGPNLYISTHNAVMRRKCYACQHARAEVYRGVSDASRLAERADAHYRRLMSGTEWQLTA